MSERIDLLLRETKNRQPNRIGDIGINAPYVHLYSGEESVMLPMPTAITSQNQILWDQKDFTADSIRGATAVGTYNKFGDLSALDVLKFGGGGAITGILKDMISSVGSAVAGVDGAGDYILHKDGKAVNPNKELTFNGIGYRSFTFEFELIPLNRKDAQSIRDFIEFFQTKAMPDFSGPVNTYFSYPDAWSIKFPKTTWLPVILSCYLTDYSIAYGGAGKMVAHEDSSVQTNISLTFTESELHTKSKIRGGAIG